MSRSTSFVIASLSLMVILSAAPALAAGPSDLPAPPDRSGTTAAEECGASSPTLDPTQDAWTEILRGVDSLGLPEPTEMCTGWGTCLQTCTPCHTTKDCPVEPGNVCYCTPYCP